MDRDSLWDLWDTSEHQGKVIKELERKTLNLEKLVTGQLDHLVEVTRLVDQVAIVVLLNVENADNHLF